MTREEAIEILKAHHMWTGEPQEIIDVRKENKALDMAIKALSQEPCDDAVSRKDAEQMFRNIRSHLKPQDYKSAEEFNTRDLMLLNAEQMIHALPSVTQKSAKDYLDMADRKAKKIKDALTDKSQKSGKWIVDAPHYICSECNYVHHLQRLEVMSGCKLGNYCPNCGAKMERSDKE